jgi:hypothetical protein
MRFVVCCRDANHCTISTDDIMQETSLPPSVHSSKRAVTSSCPSVLAGSCPADAPTTSSSYSTTSSSSDSNSSSSHPAASCAADVHLVVVVDNPSVTPEVKRWLSDLRLQLQYNLRLRYHDSNQGASATRNRCLDESLAECVIFWDDDVMPAPGCIAAYVAAFKQHPEVGSGVVWSATAGALSPDFHIHSVGGVPLRKEVHPAAMLHHTQPNHTMQQGSHYTWR